MQQLISWIEDKNKSTYVLLGLLSISYLSFFSFANQWSVYFAVTMSIICPFSIFLVWVIDSSWSDKLLNRRWTAILFAGVVVIYGMFANTFASDLINERFMVDPSYFTVTSIFLTTVYLLVGVFLPLVMLPAMFLTMLAGGIFLLIMIISSRTGKSTIKRVAFSVVIVFLFAASTQIFQRLREHLPILAEQVALKADFNEKHRCTAKWDVNIDKVIFLHDGNVFGHVANTHNYMILPCVPH